MQTIILILTFSLIYIFATELAGHLVLGKFIKENELQYFLEKNLNKYTYYNSSLKYLDNPSANIPYISKTPTFTISTKWYIGNIGRIPRWSKYSKIIDKHFKELKLSSKFVQKKLTDY